MMYYALSLKTDLRIKSKEENRIVSDLLSKMNIDELATIDMFFYYQCSLLINHDIPREVVDELEQRESFDGGYIFSKSKPTTTLFSTYYGLELKKLNEGGIF